MKKANSKKLTLAAIFAALSVVGSFIHVPVFGAMASPTQHLINVLGAIILGPSYAVGSAFVASFLRNIFGLGTLLAFPGSMCGAFLSGFLYKKFKALPYAYAGEIIGTGIIGGILSYPIAKLVMGKNAALFTFVGPFLISTCVGTLIAALITMAMSRGGALDHFKKQLEE